MILTDRALRDFEKYVESLKVAPYVSMLDSIPICYLNALITDWMDSVGYKVFAYPYANTKTFDSVILHKGVYSSTEVRVSRLEALNTAIEKVNELYNSPSILGF